MAPTKPQRIRHAINGILVLDKPLGLSSNAALQKVKWLLRAKKAGHTGALDPLATGVLPLCFGEATKFSQYLLDADKAYRTEVILGVATDSGDRDGEITFEQDASGVSLAQVEDCLQGFRGEIAQTPPMHSALKHQGQPLYKLARQGLEVPRRPRQVCIHELKLLGFEPGAKARLELAVHCSKGTYIRSLAQDIGAALGVGGHVVTLHRTLAGPFTEQQMWALPALSEQVEAIAPYSVERVSELLLPIDAGIQQLPAVEISDEQAVLLRQGRKITAPEGVRKGLVRVILRAAFIGIADADGGALQPKRLVV